MSPAESRGLVETRRAVRAFTATSVTLANCGILLQNARWSFHVGNFLAYETFSEIKGVQKCRTNLLLLVSLQSKSVLRRGRNTPSAHAAFPKDSRSATESTRARRSCQTCLRPRRMRTRFFVRASTPLTSLAAMVRIRIWISDLMTFRHRNRSGGFRLISFHSLSEGAPR